MTAKELVNICFNCKTCYDCLHDNLCDVYAEQFECYPYEVLVGFKVDGKPINPKAYSDTEISL